MDIAVARIELMGEIAGGSVLFGDDKTEPLLGVTALASLGIEIDLLNHQRKKVRPKNINGLQSRVGQCRACKERVSDITSRSWLV